MSDVGDERKEVVYGDDRIKKNGYIFIFIMEFSYS